MGGFIDGHGVDDLELGILHFGYTGRDKRFTSRIEFTLSLAQMADELGYSRFWVTEHHTQDLYNPSVEALVAAVAANTRRIRVGPAGILLHYYSPFKVAATFHTLAGLFPGRIDFGLARGIGATPEAEEFLRDGVPAPADRAASEALFERKLKELIAHLRNGREVEHRRFGPPMLEAPEIWLMGSGTWSAALAARLGIRIAMALWYITAEPVDAPAVLAEYTADFQCAEDGAPGRACISVSGICAETDAEAKAIYADMCKRNGNARPVNFCGAPKTCRAALLELAARHGVREVVVDAHDPEAEQQARTFRLLAEAMLPRGRRPA